MTWRGRQSPAQHALEIISGYIYAIGKAYDISKWLREYDVGRMLAV